MDMQWWHWAVLGLALGLLELATPGGFFILFFGIGALLVSVLAMLGRRRSAVAAVDRCSPSCPSSPSSSSAVRCCDVMRASEHKGAIDSLTADIAVAKEDILPGAVGRAELRGTSWSALNVGLAALHRGQRCAVRKVDGLTLHISAEGA